MVRRSASTEVRKCSPYLSAPTGVATARQLRAIICYVYTVTYFEDLGEYTYHGPDIVSLGGGYLRFQPRYRRLNVGWLDAPHPVPTGPVPDWLPPKLLDVAAGPQVNVMRGFHLCTLCGDAFDRSMLSVGAAQLGHAEVRVPAGDGVVFAAPTLVWHYVTAHGYRPPQAFVDALATYDPAWIDGPLIPDDAERDS